MSVEIGQPIPDTAHVSWIVPGQGGIITLMGVKAVSVSLPSWDANVGYEEGEEWVLSKMKNGYPR